MAIGEHRGCGQKWPGLDAERDGVTYPKDPKERFEQLATKLEDALEDLRGSGRGSLTELTTQGNLSAFTQQVRAIDRWEGGRAFADTLDLGHDELTKIYGQVNQKFDIAIALVRSGGGIFQAGDDVTLPGSTQI
ncbi:hypothetical protein ACGF0J_01385 [Nonomuraea sp. NPDC047897]|uniref:hypothetical protein n=1 Tax=Nonomuraea sp. NPDC047897 TaxID=3364346 RepID=UPI0037169AC8